MFNTFNCLHLTSTGLLAETDSLISSFPMEFGLHVLDGFFSNKMSYYAYMYIPTSAWFIDS